MVAPTAAVIGLYQYSPESPKAASPIPFTRAYFGFIPRTKGL